MKTSKKIVFLCFFAITMIASAVSSVFGMQKRNERDMEEEYEIIASGVYEAVQSELLKPIYTSLTMANDVFLIDMLQQEKDYTQAEAVAKLQEYLTGLKETLGAQTVFVVSEETKRYYTQDGLNKVIDPAKDEHDVWYPFFLNTRKPYDLDIDTDQVNGDSWTVFVNTRIEGKNGEVLGVCGLGLSMSRMQELLQQYEKSYGIKVNFIDSKGLVLVDTDSVNIENAILHDVQYGNEKDGYTYTNQNGEYVLMRYVESLNWYLVIHGAKNTLDAKDVVPIAAGALGIVLINSILFLILSRKEKSA